MSTVRIPSRPIAALAALLFLAISVTPASAQRIKPNGVGTLEEKLASWEKRQAMDEASPFHGLSWRSVGPTKQGGRVVDIESIPGEPYTFYVVVASGGVWKTTNNGGDFTPLFDNEATIICGDLAIDPSDSKRLWLGTGENNSSRSSYGGMGVYRSEDGGESWTWSGLGETDRIGRVLVDPKDGDRVYVGALGRLYTPGGERGVFRTTDGGKTWEPVLPGGDWAGCIDLVMDPSDSRTLYAAMWERSRRPWEFVEGGSGSGIYKTTDGGDTWTRLEGGFPQHDKVGRIGLAISAAEPDRVYAVVDNQAALPEEEWDLGSNPLGTKRLRKMTEEEFLRHDPATIDSFARGFDVEPRMDGKKLTKMIENGELTIAKLLDSLGDANSSMFDADIRGLEVWRTDDGGKSFARTHEEPIDGVVFTYGYYFGQIRVDPKDADRIYVTGVPMIASEDGGKTFAGIAGRSVHVDHHEMWIDPNYPNRIIAGNDGGLDVSYDYGKTWARMDKMALAQFYTIEVDDARPYNIYGGLQDNGTLKGSSRSRGGVDSWETIGGGDGMYVQVDSRDGTRYVGSQFGVYRRSGASGGGSVRPKRKFLEPALRYNWCTPVRLSPHNQDIVYFGTNKLFRSMDQGRKWTALSEDLTRSFERGDVPYGTITVVDESRLHFGLIWVGTDDGYVHVTEDGGNTWRDASNGLPADRWVTRVEPSRVERDRCYVSFSGYRDDDIATYLYVTEDLGRTWRDIGGGLPAEAVNVVREDPTNPDILWVGTDRSVYVSHDRGESWTTMPTGLPSVPVHDLKIHERDRDVIIGTHGRGAYVIDAEPIQSLTADIRDKDLHFWPKSDLRASRGWGSKPSPWYPRRPDSAPKTEFLLWSKAAGDVKATILDSDGNELRHFETSVIAGVNLLAYDLLLDPELALPIEEERVAKKRAKEQEKAEKAAAKKAESETEENDGDGSEEEADAEPAKRSTKGELADTPWAEAIRLDRNIGITKGSYKLRIQLGEDTEATVPFKVK